MNSGSWSQLTTSCKSTNVRQQLELVQVIDFQVETDLRFLKGLDLINNLGGSTIKPMF